MIKEADDKVSECAEDIVRTMKFGVGKRTIEELYLPLTTNKVSRDAGVAEVRSRAADLSAMMTDFLFEKSVSAIAHGRNQIALWNNLIEATEKEIQVCQLIHQSLCSEARVTRVTV